MWRSLCFLLVIFYSCREEDNLPENPVPYEQRETVEFIDAEKAILDVFRNGDTSSSFFLHLQANDEFDTLSVDDDAFICSFLVSANVVPASQHCIVDYAARIHNSPDLRLEVIVSGEVKTQEEGDEVNGQPFVITALAQDLPLPYAAREVESYIEEEKAALSLIQYYSHSSFVLLNLSSSEWDTLSIDNDSLICDLLAAKLANFPAENCPEEFAVYNSAYPDHRIEVVVSGALVQPHKGDTLRGHPFVISAIEEFIPLEYAERQTIAAVNAEEAFLDVFEENGTYRFSLEIPGLLMFSKLVVDDTTMICNLLMQNIVNPYLVKSGCAGGYQTYLSQSLDKRFKVVVSGEVKQLRESDGHFGQPFVITEIEKIKSCEVHYTEQDAVYPLQETAWKLVHFSTGFEEASYPSCENNHVVIRFLNDPLPYGTGSIGCISGAKSFSGVRSLRGGEVFGYTLIEASKICMASTLIGRSTPPGWGGYYDMYQTHDMVRVEDMLRVLFNPWDSIYFSLNGNLLHISSTNAPENQLHALFVAYQE